LAQTTLASGEQPQITIDTKGLVRIVYGQEGKIFYSISKDKGASFSKPALVGEVEKMHLGMTRGPQLASSKDFSVVTAIDQKGNIHSFILDHKTDSWKKMKNVNDVQASAPEGLMGLSADDNNNFYAVWLDLRDNMKNNNICFATLNGNTLWSKNKIVYRSPDGHVCECCKPSIVAKGDVVSIMFRNWIGGSRDLYLTTSLDKGQTFDAAQKLGAGTWKLNACPMDGGGLSIDPKGKIHTVWRREGQIFSAEPGQREVLLGDGRGCNITGDLMSWANGSNLIIKRRNGEQLAVGEGSALKLNEFDDHVIVAVWENDKKVIYKTIR
jgi:hypothetical protein